MKDNREIEDAQIIGDESESNQPKRVNKIKDANAVSIISIDNKTGKPDLSKYSQQELQKFGQMGNSLKTSDANSILNYGLDLQNKLASYSDSFLNNVRTFDAGEIGGSINDLLTNINYIDIDPSQQSGLKRIISQIPGLRKLVVNTKKIFQKYDTVSNNIDGITKKLDQGRLTIIKDNNQLQTLFDQNLTYIAELEELIIAGHIKLDEFNKEVADMEMHPEKHEDYEIADAKEFVSRLSKRLNDMALTRMITLQSLPQIRLVQNNNITMAEKIQSSLVTTIPLWRNQISIAVAQMRQKAIADINQKVYDTTNEILLRNSQMLKTNSIEIAKQNERGVVAIETLRTVQSDLISTLNDIKRIKDEGETARKTVAKELEVLETELKSNVLQLSTEGKTKY